MFSSDTTQVSDGGYQISRSLRFNSADTAYLNRTPASAGNRRTWTFSAWIKRSALSGGNYPQLMSADGGTFGSKIGYFADDTFWVDVGQGATYTRLTSTAVYRDVSAWYHVVVAQDTTQATDTNRVKVYINGSQITLSGTYPTQNFDGSINNNSAQNIGRETSASYYFNGYITDVNFIDGQALTPSSFGETNAQTGVWQPKAYSGSYGTNGFYLNFSDNSNTTAATLGKDYSGNGNNWTPNNFLVSAGVNNDSLVDTPTPYGVDTGAGGTVGGNYCTFNPLFKLGGTTALTWALNGNLQAKSDSNASMVVYGTMGLDPSTKLYNEFTMTNTVEGADHVGIVTDIQAVADGGTCVAYRADGQKIVNGTVSSYGASYTDNDVIGIAVNLVDNQVTFYKNGTSQGAITGVTSATYFHRVRFNNLAGQQTEVYGNWGQRAFANTAPSGFKALCTQNLPTPTIGATTATQASKFFTPVIYNGTNQTPQNITTVGFQPDFVWIKWRANSYYHNLFDVTRGVNNVLSSNVGNAEGTRAGTLTSFNSDGFSLGNDSTYSGVNIDATSYVAWNWKANGSGSTNTAGSITSTVSANTTSGFSVVTYTGTGANATVGHGLGVAPSMVIVKNRGSAVAWAVWHTSIANTEYLVLNTAGAVATGATWWNSTTPTSTVFSIGTSTSTNTSATTYVAYAFAPIAGYSAFGSFTGNASTDGPFVFTGFRPAYILLKNTDPSFGVNWVVIDIARNTSNVANRRLYPNVSDAEDPLSNAGIDILSNGFKLRTTDGALNGNGAKTIYAAFAETPLKFSLAR